MVLDVKQLYRKIIEDPDIIADNETSKETLAMDMATQRVVQHERNMQANNLGSSVSKLLQFVEKAEDDEEDDEEENVDLTDFVEQAHEIISESENPNVEHSETILGDLGAMGIGIGDAESALGEYKDMKRSDYENDAAYTGERKEAWEEFLKELQSTEATEVDISNVDSRKFEDLDWAELAEEPPAEMPEEEVGRFLEDAPAERGAESKDVALPVEEEFPNTSVWEGHPVMEAVGGAREGDVGKSIIAVQMTPAVVARHKAATGRAKDAIRKEAQKNAEKHFKSWYKKEFGKEPTYSDTPIFTAHEDRGASTANWPWRGVKAEQLQGERVPENREETDTGQVDPADVDVAPTEEADAAEKEADAVAEEDDAEEDDAEDTSHIFHHSSYSVRDKKHINHMHEVDEANDNKWSKHLQELKDKFLNNEGENPTVGTVKLFRPTRVGGAALHSVNIGAAQKYFGAHEDFKRDAGKLALPATETGTGRQGPEEGWVDKVNDLLMTHGGEEWKYKGSGDRFKTETGPAMDAFERKVDRLIRDGTNRDASSDEVVRQEEDIRNKAYEDEAARLGIDITSAGDRPKLPDIQTTPAEATAENIVRPHRSTTSSGQGATAAGRAIDERHQEVLQDIATDDSISDEERADAHDEAQSVMERVAANLGRDASSEIDTSKTSEEAVGEHTGRHIDTSPRPSQTQRLMEQLGEAKEAEGRRHTGEYEFKSPDDKPLAQVGEPHTIMDKTGKVAHTATGTDDNPVHYVLTEHEDGSGSFSMVNALTGETVPNSVKHFPTGRAGGFERATNEYNELLTHDESETPLEGYTPEAPPTEEEEAPTGGEGETPPPITGTRRPGEAQYGFRDMPRSRAGTTPGKGTPTEPPKEEERTGPLEGQARLPEDEEGGGGDEGGDGDGGGAGTDEGDDKTPPITGVKGKGGQYKFRTGEGGIPRARKGARAGEGEPVEPPEDTRRGIDVAAEAEDARREAAAKDEDGVAPEKVPLERGEQAEMSEEMKRQESGRRTTRSLSEREAGDEQKSALLDRADGAGIFEYLSDTKSFSYGTTQEARENLAELDIKDLRNTLDGHQRAARQHLLSKEPETAPVKKDRKKLEEHLAKVRGTTADDEFRENHQYHSTEELEAEIKATVKANTATQKNTETADAAADKRAKQTQRIQNASNSAQTMPMLPKGTGPIQAQQRMREILNIMHEHNTGLPEKARARLNDLSQDAIKNGADVEAIKREAVERVGEPNKGWDDEWVAAGAKRAKQDQAEHDEYHQHLTDAAGLASRSEAFERSGAGMMVQTDEEGNVTGSTHTAADYDEPITVTGDEEKAFKHHGGHDESGKPKMFGESEPPKILGQNPEQKEAQQAHHAAVQSGDTAAQQSIEELNPHLVGTGKSETELEEERIASCKPPGPPPPSKNRLEWNCNTHRWCNPDTVRGIQDSLKDGEVAVMPNGIHAGTEDSHLDDPNNLSTHSAGGHRGNMNIDGTHQTGAVVVSNHGTHAATTPAGPATAKTVGPMGHKDIAAHATGKALLAHKEENPKSYVNPDGTSVNRVNVKNAHAPGTHFANTGLFGSKSHFSTPGKGVIRSALSIFSRNRVEGSTPLTKSIIISKAIKPKKKATSKNILFSSGRLSHDSKQAIKEQIKNAQILRELEDYAYGSQKKQ